MQLAWGARARVWSVCFFSLVLLALLAAACSDQAGPIPDGEGGSAGGPAENVAGSTPTNPSEEVPETPEGPRPGPLLTAECPSPETQDPVPSDCCGCLCASERWSCSIDTCVDEQGQVQELGAEAGYIEIPGESYTSRLHLRTSPDERVFYSFRPAEDAPEDRPLAVFFNGGPGGATTDVLMALNTGPHTLDPERTGEAEIAPNEHSFTEHFNLLFVDAPRTGFSYAPAVDDDEVLAFDPDRDAGIFNHVLLFFLDRHPALTDNRVVLVGESYGGIRAGQMLRQLLSPETLLEADSPYGDERLYCALQRHMRRGDAARDEIETADIAAQFGHLGLIQPWLLGSLQDQHSAFDESVCVSDFDRYQCDEPLGFDEGMVEEVGRRLLVPENLALMLGTDPRTIAWFDAARPYASLVPIERIGRAYQDPYMGAEFLLLLPHLKKTLVTRAELDLVVDSYGFVNASRALGAQVDEAPSDPPGATRPGVVSITASSAGPGMVRMPRYPTAGHAVTRRAPGEFLEDLVQWMAAE